ncbi:MAG TPA: pyridoxamine 5'-phosphate oxidase [Acidimicrobiia bacterium]|nr:pyridoxamine 5'-phosphate oxidase [Acidimicrobiia bacterium]
MHVPDIASLRIEYESVGIDPADMGDDPVEEFTAWLTAAVEAGVVELNAFVLATATPDGMPSARAVLLKEIGPEGLSFFTNLDSRKGRELRDNPRAAGCFVWLELHRQVRVEGRVVQLPDEIADAYFASRPPGSRLAAAVSAQSEVVENRAVLDRAYDELLARHPDGDIPRPERWGGFCLEPDVFEFWQGRPNRFHDRVRYRLAVGGWVKERLAP